ncbi:MAG: PaaI family thioesterase, partial [Pseudomonadota bacterium]
AGDGGTAMTDNAKFGGGASGTVLDDWPMPPSADFIGFEFGEFDREAMALRTRFRASEAMLNPAGTVQGGFLGVMLDEVMGSLVVALHEGRLRPATTDLHTQYFKAAYPGPLFGFARVTRMGRSMAFTEGTISDEAGDVVALAIQTAKLLPIPGAPA